MSQKTPASLSDKGAQSFTQRGGPLSISTSKPRPFEDVGYIQSPNSKSALPHPSPHRTLSGPAALPTSSFEDVLGDKSRSPISPKSAGSRLKSLRFDKADDPLKKSKTTSPGGISPRDDFKRRHSADPKLNVHTECGRHSDDWLFGGWDKIWDRKPKT